MPDGGAAVSVHRFPVRVYYEDTDAAGLVYYANYPRFAERARTEMLRAAGIDSSDLATSDGVALVVRRCAADYVKPARFDDALIIETRILDIGGASITLEQSVCRDGDVLVRMNLKLGCFNLDSGRAERLPARLRSAFGDPRSSKTPRT